MLTKTRTIMERKMETKDVVIYHSEHDPEYDPQPRSLYLDRERYDDMGKPAVVTVTIEPGDKLNTG